MFFNKGINKFMFLKSRFNFCALLLLISFISVNITLKEGFSSSLVEKIEIEGNL